MFVNFFSYGQNFEEILKKANNGDTKAQYELGKIYGKEKEDFKKAFYWF